MKDFNYYNQELKKVLSTIKDAIKTLETERSKIPWYRIRVKLAYTKRILDLHKMYHELNLIHMKLRKNPNNILILQSVSRILKAFEQNKI